ncbi:6-carboxytetrahydropterin synthase QueD [Adhaeribacter aerolatus]|uniref:6-carboxy-5,6,7,8-tetrahydropterin synthase n=1 Tax=Adhaeribacter aerolatus TaxID=670289 RepID=A0A512B2H2_9BACT|nr:6-carboxytetrahydropterin synthase [Adhaeribacter aerolatus]GEO06161.1 6-carboxytetrahydropterin synthase QueD [Adhaeribacter aerolatus]
MKIAKQFRWEGAHRLPNHKGNCRNLHGHSYKMTIELKGMLNEEGMVVDFADLKALINPLIEAWDHATLVAEGDEDLINVLNTLGSKYFVLPYNSTSENLCQFVIDFIIKDGYSFLIKNSISEIRVLIRETDTCYAELERSVILSEEEIPNSAYSVVNI